MNKDTLTVIPPDHALTGRVMPPGSKSITNVRSCSPALPGARAG